ncbi:uncharacterized protein TNCV_488521 [Trichonephila clavipes]|nr:uncharacterized protein TNCV_488521 [Trichonephila clavipes]
MSWKQKGSSLEEVGRAPETFVGYLNLFWPLSARSRFPYNPFLADLFNSKIMAAVAEWSRYRIVACLVTSSSPVPLKTRRVEQRCTLNMSRAETSSSWCGVVVRRGGASSGVVHVT